VGRFRKWHGHHRQDADATIRIIEIGAALWQKSGTGILPVMKGHHRQDADATIHIIEIGAALWQKVARASCP